MLKWRAVSDPRPDPLTAFAAALAGRPWRVVAVALALTLAAGALAWRGLEVETDRMRLIGEQHRFHQNFRELLAEFGDVDAMVVLLRAPDRPSARTAGDRLAARLAAEPALFPNVYYRVPPEALAGKALLFLDLEAVAAIEARLRLGRPAVRGLLERGLGGFFEEAAALVGALGAQEEAPPDAAALGFLPAFAETVAAGLAGERPPPPWRAWIPPGALAGRDGYTWTSDGRLVLLVQPARERDLESVGASVRRLRVLLGEEVARTSGLEVGLTGEPVLEVDELATFQRDAWWATLASLVGVTLLLAIATRRLVGPILATASLAAALIVTLGAVTLWPGRLNLISAAFCALLIGLGIDYAIHWVSRYDEERARGREGAAALAAALRATGWAIAAGAATTALAFLATVFTEVEGIREFGVVAGIGVVLALVATTTLLPATIVLADRGLGGRRARPRSAWPRSRLAWALDRAVERRPGAVLLACVALTALAAAYAGGVGAARPRVGYDADLLALQVQELESVRLAREVLLDERLSGMFCAITCADVESLRRLEREFRRLETVRGTSSILDVVPPDQPAKLALLARIRATLAEVPREPARDPRPARERAAHLARALEALVGALEQAARGALRAGEAQAVEWVVGLQERLEALGVAARAALADPAAAARLARYEERLVHELGDALAGLAREAATAPLEIDTLPAVVRDRFVGRTGKLLLRVYPAVDVWTEDGLRRFVEEVRRVAPDAGGVPVQFYAADALLRDGYVRASLLALAFVAFYLVVHFRGALLPVVALLTLLAGATWAAGALALLGVDLNPANLLALPLVLGIGIDYPIHLIHRDREARRFPSLAGAPAIVATSTGRAVFLSALTTCLAFGALALSDHRGIASIGVTICVGVGASLLASVLLCPALLRLWSGPTDPPPLEGLPGPKIGPGGAVRRPPQPPVQDPPAG